MPIPKPKKKEKKKKYITRCMANKTMVKEYKNISQRMAICQQQWRNK